MLLPALLVTLVGLVAMLVPHLGAVVPGLVVFTVGFFAAHAVASGWVGSRSTALGVQGPPSTCSSTTSAAPWAVRPGHRLLRARLGRGDRVLRLPGGGRRGERGDPAPRPGPRPGPPRRPRRRPPRRPPRAPSRRTRRPRRLKGLIGGAHEAGGAVAGRARSRERARLWSPGRA
ncbi:hypothetical protein NKH77_25580 [Streptomyces sp. M19]